MARTESFPVDCIEGGETIGSLDTVMRESSQKAALFIYH